jgi:hypothetical protein
MMNPPAPAQGRSIPGWTRTPLLLAALLVWAFPATAGTDWIPPRPVSLVAPSVTLSPGQPRLLAFTLRANRVPANLSWSLTLSGPGPASFTPTVVPSSGTVSLAADQTVSVPITVTVPGTAPVPSTGFITFNVAYATGGKAASSVTAMVRAATGGRPEFYPAPDVAAAPAGGPNTVTYTLHSTIGTSEQFNIGVTRTNPDPTNSANLIPYTAPATPVTLPGAGTVTVSIPTFIPGNAFPGNLAQFRVTANSVTDLTKGQSDAIGFSFASSADPDSLPAAFYPAGLVTQEQVAAGRDGLTPLPGRGLLLVPSGNLGVQVVSDSVMDQVGPLDLDNNTLDDRVDGRIRPPSYSASIAVVPGFVNTTTNDILDLGLLAAGRGGLMLIDLRDLIDPPSILWEDWWDLDGNGIDDRILRRLPIPGFATDVQWFRSAEGRVIALVAAADTGSVPTAVGYNPGLTVPGTGAGVVAIDVQAALDSLDGVPFMAGTLPTAGNVLDLEIRGGPDPELAVADGANGVSFVGLTATGAPATVAFTSLGDVALDATYGTPHARDLAWVPISGDSVYLAVAAGPGGVQIIKDPHGGTPFLALVQRVEAPAIGIASSLFGYLGVAMGTSGATLLRLPLPTELDQIDPLGTSPYQAPVLLGLGTSWTEGRPLRSGIEGSFSSSTTALVFRDFTGGATAPDLLCADGPRTLLVRSGTAGVLGVGDPRPPAWTPGLELRVAPNPMRDRAEFRVLGGWPMASAIAPGQPVDFSIVDLQGRLVRRLSASSLASASQGVLASVRWDGLDQGGRPAAPGRYWVRAAQRGGWTTRAGFLRLR